jgi:hypothetical protein
MKKNFVLFIPTMLLLLAGQLFSQTMWSSYPGYSSGWGPTEIDTSSAAWTGDYYTPIFGGSWTGTWQTAVTSADHYLVIYYYPQPSDQRCVPTPCGSGTSIVVPAAEFPKTDTYYFMVELAGSPTLGAYIIAFIDGNAMEAINYPTGVWCGTSGCPELGTSRIYPVNQELGDGVVSFQYMTFASPITLTANTKHTLAIEFQDPCGIEEVSGCSGTSYNTSAYWIVGQVVMYGATETYTPWCNYFSNSGVPAGTKMSISLDGLEDVTADCEGMGSYDYYRYITTDVKGSSGTIVNYYVPN